MSQKHYRYLTNCMMLGDDGDIEALGELLIEGQQISYATFRRYVDEEELRRLFPQYDWGSERGGLRLRNDWHVAYYLSRFKGRPCVYVNHSAVEYIFQE